MYAMQARRNQPRTPKRCKLNDEKFQSAVVIQADEPRSKLDTRYPSFIKSLVKSHVTGGFWMGLPAPFCQKHLPQKDTFIALETENKKRYRAKYLVKRTGLSGWWKGFAISERLSIGDVVVFHLVSITTFKVYMIKENNFTVVDRAIFLPNSETHEEQTDLQMFIGTGKGKDFPKVDQGTMPPPEDSDSNVTVNSSGTVNSSRAPHKFSIRKEAAKNLEVVSTFDIFSSIIDELLKDYELPRHIKWSYYKLCCSQNILLHDSLPKWMNHILVGGIIIETVTIADALRQCALSTSKEEFTLWDKTLNALELMGMSIGFLRVHMRSLQAIMDDPDIASLKRKHAELCSKHVGSEDEIRALMSKLTEIRKEHSKRAVDIEGLKIKIKNHEFKFQEQVNAPW